MNLLFSRRHWIATALALALGFTAATHAAEDARTFELRIYVTNEGKLPDLLKRFRDHTCKLFEKHGMENIGYWVPGSEFSDFLINLSVGCPDFLTGILTGTVSVDNCTLSFAELAAGTYYIPVQPLRALPPLQQKWFPSAVARDEPFAPGLQRIHRRRSETRPSQRFLR